MTKQASGRILYIDVIETLAIYLVVYCHWPQMAGTSVFANITLQLSTTIAVPLFFMCNGALLLSRERLDVRAHYRKTLMLFVAMEAWKAIFLILQWALFPDRFVNVGGLAAYFLGSNEVQGLYLPTDQFWFLQQLIGVYLIYPFLHEGLRKYPEMMRGCIIFLVVFVCCLNEYDSIRTVLSARGAALPDISSAGWYFPLGNGGYYLAFFLMGHVIHTKCYGKGLPRKTATLLLVGAFVSFALVLVEKYVQERTLVGEWVRLDHDYQRLPVLLMSCFFYAFFASVDLSGLSEKAQVLFSFVSKRTMNIYIVHMSFCMLFDKVLASLMPYRGVAVYALRTLAIVAVSLLVTEPLTYIEGPRIVLGLAPSHRSRLRDSCHASD